MNPSAYVILILMVANVVTGGLWLNERRAVSELRASAAEATTDRVREQQREIGRLIAVTTNLNEAYREQIQTIDTAQRRAGDDAERLRRLKSERDAAIKTAAPGAVRDYAATAGDVYESCRAEYRALGFDAERCSAAAHALGSYAAEVSHQRPTPPAPPNPPAKP